MKKEYNTPIADVVLMASEDHFLVGSISGSVSGPVGSNAKTDNTEWGGEDAEL